MGTIEADVGIAVASGQFVAVARPRCDEGNLLMLHSELKSGDFATVSIVVYEAVSNLLAGADVRASSVGVSVGGHINSSSRLVVYAQDVVCDGVHWENEPVGPKLQSLFQCNVFLDNDANCMAGFHHDSGIARDSEDFSLVYIAPEVQGVGSAYCSNGRVNRGATGGAGEIGHVILQPDGPRCHCGNRGCLVSLVSSTNILREVNWGGRPDAALNLAGASRLASLGDDRAVQAFSHAGQFFGQGLAAIINLLNPSLMIIGGPPELLETEPPQGGSSDFFRSGLSDSLARLTYSSLGDACRVVIHSLSLQEAAQGAMIAASRPASW